MNSPCRLSRVRPTPVLAGLLCLLGVGCGQAIAVAGPMRVGAWITYWHYDSGLERTASAPLDDVFFFAVELDGEGRPVLAQPELDLRAAVRQLSSRGAATWLTVVNDVRPGGNRRPVLKDAATTGRLLRDAKALSAHRRGLVEMATLYGFSGVDVDFENLAVEDRDAYTAFVQELAADLKERGLRLSVTVQPKRAESRSVGPGAADWAQLCKSADRLQVMLYNQHSSKSGPGPIATPTWMREVLDYARGQCEPARVVPVLKVSGIDWGPRGTRDVRYVDAMALVAVHGATLEREASAAVPHFRYTASDGAHTVYFEDATSIGRKVAALEEAGYGSLVLWSLGGEDPEILPSLLGKKPGASPSPAAPDAAPD